MKNMVKQIKNSKGYVSVETIVIAGLAIGVGVVAFMAFQAKANSITKSALDKVEEAGNSAIVKPLQ